jgi:hypothetical protein
MYPTSSVTNRGGWVDEQADRERPVSDWGDSPAGRAELLRVSGASSNSSTSAQNKGDVGLGGHDEDTH